MIYHQVGLGGSCHWCTEAIFLSLRGVKEVKQGWIESMDSPSRFSEAVIVRFDAGIITLQTLLTIHLHTHSSTSRHSMREKYRSAIYTFSPDQQELAASFIKGLQQDFPEPIITEVIPFGSFRLNKPEYLNYYFADPRKPFCVNIVNPKLLQLLRQFSGEVDKEKLSHLLLISKLLNQF